MYTIYPSTGFRRNSISHDQPMSYLPPLLFHDAASHSLVEVQGVVPPGTVVYRVFDAASIPLTAPPQEMSINLLGTHHDGSRLYWKLPGCSAGAFLTTVYSEILSNASGFSPEWINAEIVSFIFTAQVTSLRHRQSSSSPLAILRSISEGSNAHYEAPGMIYDTYCFLPHLMIYPSRTCRANT